MSVNKTPVSFSDSGQIICKQIAIFRLGPGTGNTEYMAETFNLK